MSTVQKAIRDAIFTRLTAQIPDVTVFRSPRRSIDDSEIPCVCVFSHGDRPADADSNHSETHQRIYTVRIEVIANGRPEEDATDELASKVRTVVLSEGALPNGNCQVSWAGQVWSGDEGDPVQALTGLDFDITYFWSPE